MPRQRLAERREDVDFRVLRLIEQRPTVSQREIASEVGVSLGAINYCLKALMEKGHVKLANFGVSENKLRYVYVLTPEGIAHRVRLTSRFIERKLAEYNAIRAEIDELRQEIGGGEAEN